MRAVSEVMVGDQIAPWLIDAVDPARMKTMAAILRDPYSVHWDRADNLRNGIGSRVINQGPLNLGYIANMLMAWAGTTSIRRLVVSFGNPVFDGDRVVARGIVTHLEMHHDEQLATCEVWLDRDGERVVWGTATVCLPTRPPTPPATRPPTQQLSVSDDDRNHAPSRWPQRDRNYT